MNNHRRQHPLWMIYQIGLSIKEVIVPVIIFFVINFQSEALWVKIGSVGVIMYIVYKMIAIFFEWKNSTYLFTENNIELFEGRFIADKRYIALNRIQGYQEQRTFLHRLFQLTSLMIMTGSSSDNAVVKLEMISQVEAEGIIKILKKYEQESTLSIHNNLNQDGMKNQPKIHYKIPFKEIVLISLSSYYFLAIFPILLSIYAKMEEFFAIDTYLVGIYDFLKQSTLVIILVTIVIVLVAVGSGILITYLRFGNYEVSSDPNQIFISKGVLNISNYTIPRQKINGVVIQKTFPRRLFNIVKVEIVSLGDLFDEQDLQTDVLFPFIMEGRLKKLLPEIIPEYKVEHKMNSVPKQALFVNLIQPSYFLVIVTFLIFFFWPEFWFIPLALFILIVVYRVIKTSQTKYVQIANRIQFQTGALSTEIFITKREKIDVLEAEQSWLQRKLQLATISITTRAKPIHMSKLEQIPEKKVEQYYEWYQQEE